MFGNSKNAFWEALLLTCVVFIFGMLVGVSFEASRMDKINEYYAMSEISLMDAFTFTNAVDIDNISCSKLVQANINFANNIYEEARLLEKYEEAGKISENIKLAHKKYDVLRTFLWVNLMKTREKCEKDFSSVVYLYEYETEDLAKKATQKVWSRILFDLKQEKGDGIILISIAADRELESLDAIIEKFEISKFPAVIINDEHVIIELTSVEDLEGYF